MTTQELLIKAKAAKSKLGSIKAADIDRALLMMADQLIENTDAILAANALDVEAAKGNISTSPNWLKCFSRSSQEVSSCGI